MNNEISWLLELNVNDGALDGFKALMEEMVEVTRGESGTLSYAWFINDAGTEVKISECYADSDAVLAHMKTFGEQFAERFLSAVSPSRFTIMGSPNDAVKEVFAPFSPSYLVPLGGFVR